MNCVDQFARTMVEVSLKTMTTAGVSNNSACALYVLRTCLFIIISQHHLIKLSYRIDKNCLKITRGFMRPNGVNGFHINTETKNNLIFNIGRETQIWSLFNAA